MHTDNILDSSFINQSAITCNWKVDRYICITIFFGDCFIRGLVFYL